MEKENLVKLLLQKKWDITNIELAIRAKCKCEYCDKNLIESIENYKLWQVDHIIPKSSDYENSESIDNKALSCVQCNKDFKGRWNPAKKIGYNKKREKYIIEVREYVQQRRIEKQVELNEMKNILIQLLE